MDRGRTIDDQKSSLELSAQVRYKEKMHHDITMP